MSSINSSLRGITDLIEEGKARIGAGAKSILPSSSIPSRGNSSTGLTAWTVMTIYPQGKAGGGRVGRRSSAGGAGTTWVLPLPTDLSDINSISYEPTGFNSLMRLGASGSQEIKQLTNTVGQSAMDLAQGNVSAALTDLFSGGSSALQSLVTNNQELQNAFSDFKQGKAGNQILDLIGNLAPEGVSNVLLGTQGVASNPNMEALFKGANLRTHSFSWNLTPLKSQDSAQIVSFIKEVKKSIYPSYNTGTRGGIFSLQNFPAEFELTFNASSSKGGAKRIFATAACACTDMTISFTPQGGFFTHEDGRATNVSINMTFQEVYTLDQGDIDNLTIE
jgi:hypothetical protein